MKLEFRPAKTGVARRRFLDIAIICLMLIFGVSNAMAQVADFSHPDTNPYSPRNGQNVGPYDAVNNGSVTMWYHQYNKY